MDVKRGETSREFYLPGLYCQAGLQVSYDGLTAAEKSGILRVDGDLIEVYKGSSFLNNKCKVNEVKDESVKLRCGSESFELKLVKRSFAEGDLVKWLDDDKNRKWEISDVKNVDGKVSYSIKEVKEAGVGEVKPDIEAVKLRQISSDKLKEKWPYRRFV